ncbi:histidine triad nucleotide-binding protein [Sporothrix brasiliensis 5110]|uniref:Histidine triad nucleotide-binding protein n=1 Tax=Sporothrix brasiliensis 5110 TaxID=1398154 RepID=A0A0C2IPF7_9PEZI|nr:histidine triad nucleotide-binding protein [Sporothrix brasiliensis 5110]KIH86957.1 histidine triad nucleotide-binding protein [Sporothrix brasiliensis 5110]
MASKGKPKPKQRARGASFRAIADAGFRKFQSREALGMYIDNPGAYMGSKTYASSDPKTALSVAGQVIYYSDNFVAIHDKFPKASVHCLLLPRDPRFYQQHPVFLLSRRDDIGKAFLHAIRAEAEKLRAIVAAELRRRFGKFSAADALREAVLRGEADAPGGGDSPSQQLPAGRDWSKDVVVGVHARPSMSHLHVHVFSRDMHSEKVRHRKHYNSFTTPFLVPLDEFPLAADDPRQPHDARMFGSGAYPGTGEDAGDVNDSGEDSGGEMDVDSRGAVSRPPHHHLNYLQSDMRCWRCGKNFGNRFQELKRHLDVEFEAWKRE